MCEICRKYRCPNGCPNNYTPRGRQKERKGARIGWKFVTVRELDSGGATLSDKPTDIRKNNNEIISKF